MRVELSSGGVSIKTFCGSADSIKERLADYMAAVYGIYLSREMLQSYSLKRIVSYCQVMMEIY